MKKDLSVVESSICDNQRESEWAVKSCIDAYFHMSVREKVWGLGFCIQSISLVMIAISSVVLSVGLLPWATVPVFVTHRIGGQTHVSCIGSFNPEMWLEKASALILSAGLVGFLSIMVVNKLFYSPEVIEEESKIWKSKFVSSYCNSNVKVLPLILFVFPFLAFFILLLISYEPKTAEELINTLLSLVTRYRINLCGLHNPVTPLLVSLPVCLYVIVLSKYQLWQARIGFDTDMLDAGDKRQKIDSKQLV